MGNKKSSKKILPESMVIKYIKKAEEQEEEIQLQNQIAEYEKYEIITQGGIPKYLTDY